MSPGSESKSEPQARRPLSVGDALVVIALLLFILAWLVGWALIPNWDVEVKSVGGIGDMIVTIFLIAVIACPALWAGDHITDIIKGEQEPPEKKPV